MRIQFYGGYADEKVVDIREPLPRYYYIPVPSEVSFEAPVRDGAATLDRMIIHSYELTRRGYVFEDVEYR